MIVLQMIFVDVFATVPNVETDIWANIATLGLMLNWANFLDNFYVVEEDQILQFLGS